MSTLKSLRGTLAATLIAFAMLLSLFAPAASAAGSEVVVTSTTSNGVYCELWVTNDNSIHDGNYIVASDDQGTIDTWNDVESQAKGMTGIWWTSRGSTVTLTMHYRKGHSVTIEPPHCSKPEPTPTPVPPTPTPTPPVDPTPTPTPPVDPTPTPTPPVDPTPTPTPPVDPTPTPTPPVDPTPTPTPPVDPTPTPTPPVDPTPTPTSPPESTPTPVPTLPPPPSLPTPTVTPPPCTYNPTAPRDANGQPICAPQEEYPNIDPCSLRGDGTFLVPSLCVPAVVVPPAPPVPTPVDDAHESGQLAYTGIETTAAILAVALLAAGGMYAASSYFFTEKHKEDQDYYDLIS